MINRKSIYLLLLTVVASLPIILGGCGGSAERTEVLNIKGSTTVLPVAQATAEAFMHQNKASRIPVQGGGSSIGISAVIDGTTDIGSSSREAKQKEIEKVQEAGFNLAGHVVAMDGIAVIIHPSNQIEGLSLEQIKSIYQGKIVNWKALGGPDREIVMVHRDTSSGTFETFHKIVMDEDKSSPRALTMASNQAVSSTVGKTPGAIGYIGLGYLSNKVKDIKVDEVAISEALVISQEYPISRPLYMYTKGIPQGIVAEYLDFVKSKEGQKIVKEVGFIPISK